MATCRGQYRGKVLVVETKFARLARKIPLTTLQQAFVVGSVLGDATLMPTTAGACFRVHHGREQHEYVDWKHTMLASYVRTKPRECQNGYYFRTITHPEFSKLRELFYPESRKIVPVEVLNAHFTTMSLAVWIMDDGSPEGGQLRPNTQSFSIDEVGALGCLLRAKFGLDARINIDKGRPRLRFVAASMDRLVAIVKPYIVPTMLYKLPL